MRGRFITFEGPEGSGKSTQAQWLVERLKEEGVPVVQTREPGGTPLGEAIRGILQHDTAGEPPAPRAELLLFEASRAQLVSRVVLPALAAGTWVVCDRFADSTTAYQGYGRGLDLDLVLAMNAAAVGDAVPDLTLLLDVEVADGFRRTEHRPGRDRMEREEIAFHESVRRGFLELAARWPDRIRVVRTDRSPDATRAAIWDIVSRVLLKARMG
jgi:dTMP kinase